MVVASSIVHDSRSILYTPAMGNLRHTVKLEDAVVGKRVAYVPLHISAYEDVTEYLIQSPINGIEHGNITSYNDKNIFVRFDKQHPTAPGQACCPEDLYELVSTGEAAYGPMSEFARTDGYEEEEEY
jgi:hypothetical protein